MKKLSVYGVLSLASLLVRQFLLPNPFECFGNMAVIYNWIAEPILHIVAYSLVGLVYCKGSLPALGTILYLAVYSTLVGLLHIFGIFNFVWWWILIIVLVFIGLVILTAFLFSKFFELDDEY